VEQGSDDAVGHKAIETQRPERITTRAFLREMASELLDMDRGLLHTFLGMCTAPGRTIRRWVIERDPRLTRPFRYFLIVVATALLIQQISGITDNDMPYFAGQPANDAAQVKQADDDRSLVLAHGAQLVARGVHSLRAEHRELLMLMLIPFVAFGLWCTNRRERWYFAEYWVALTYAYASSYLLQSLIQIGIAPFTESHLEIARVARYGLLMLMLLRLHAGPLPGALLRTLGGFIIATLCLFAFILLLGAILAMTAQLM
jgi:hypothetical protein